MHEGDPQLVALKVANSRHIFGCWRLLEVETSGRQKAAIFQDIRTLGYKSTANKKRQFLWELYTSTAKNRGQCGTDILTMRLADSFSAIS